MWDGMFKGRIRVVRWLVFFFCRLSVSLLFVSKCLIIREFLYLELLTLSLECGLLKVEIVTLHCSMKSKINVQFGKRVAELRKLQGISQEELAFRCDVHRTYIGSIERGEKSPTLNTIEKFAKGLGVEIIELFKYDPRCEQNNDF